MSRRARAVFLVIGCCATFAWRAGSATGAAEERRADGPTYLIFLDLTLSLNKRQVQSRTEEIRQLAGGIPARSHVVIYPLGGYVERAGVLLERRFPDDQFATGRSAVVSLRKSLPQILEKAATDFQSVANDPEFSKHTCISDGIRQAAQAIVSRTSGGRTEVVFISDMLEDCSQSLLGGQVSLEKWDIQGEIKRAKHLPPGTMLVDLQGANVSCIIPASAGTVTTTHQPHDLGPLKEFWGVLLSHCNTRKESFFLGAGVPERLRAQ